MPCTTLLVGKGASNDGSTMIARTDDGHFDVKRTVVVEPRQQRRLYKSKIAHLSVELPDNPMRYTACPSVDPKRGVWAATGINAANVGMTATETITSNPRVLAADPLVEYQKPAGRKKEVPGGIGEEDIVVLVLPYIKSAREGVERLGSLLEQYGTYESNGIAFNDRDEVWWLESVGGHHWLARKVPDDAVVIAPNYFNMDSFDLDDALGAKKDNLCSADLREFVEENRLDLSQDGRFNPREAFGSHSDNDHVYNTPRAWYLGRCLTPRSHRWDGPDAEFTPESDDIPWMLVPDRKVTVEEVKRLLSTHYQGTPFDPYAGHDTGERGKYRSIGINRTGVTSICQIRNDAPEQVAGLEWVCYASTAFGAALPLYPNVPGMPDYVSKVGLDVSTDNLYWATRLVGALADHDFPGCVQDIERYQEAVMTRGRQIVREYDRKMAESKDWSLASEANEKLCEMARKETTEVLGKVLDVSSKSMRNGFNRADN